MQAARLIKNEKALTYGNKLYSIPCDILLYSRSISLSYATFPVFPVLWQYRTCATTMKGAIVWGTIVCDFFGTVRALWGCAGVFRQFAFTKGSFLRCLICFPCIIFCCDANGIALSHHKAKGTWCLIHTNHTPLPKAPSSTNTQGREYL